MKQESDSAESKKDSRKSRSKKKSGDGKKDPNDSLTEIVTRMRKLSLQENSTPEKSKQPPQDEATPKVASSGDASSSRDTPSSGGTALSGDASPGNVLPSGDASSEDVTGDASFSETNLTAVDMSLTFMESPEESFNTTTTLSSMDETLISEPRYVFDPSCEENKKNDFFPIFDTMTLMKDEHFSNFSLGRTSSSFSLHTPLFDTVPIGSAYSMPDFIPMPPARVPKDPKDLEKEEAVAKEAAAKIAEERRAKLTGLSKSADLSADAAQKEPSGEASQQNCDAAKQD